MNIFDLSVTEARDRLQDLMGYRQKLREQIEQIEDEMSELEEEIFRNQELLFDKEGTVWIS